MNINPVHSLTERIGDVFARRCVSVATNIGITGNSTKCDVEFVAALVKRVAEYRGKQRLMNNRSLADKDAIVAQLNVTAFGAGLLHGKAA